MTKLGSFVVALGAATCGWALSQESSPSAVAAMQAPSVQPPADASQACCPVPDGTAVLLEILEPLDSSLVKRGDKFRIRLAEPVIENGQTVLPAGIEGMGEIVHAAPSRGGGKAGELLLAARYLDHPNSRVTLRSMKLGGVGKDNTNVALALAIAVGPLAQFLHGREILIPAGTLAQAKVAQSSTIAPPQANPVVSSPTPLAEATSEPAAPQQAPSVPNQGKDAPPMPNPPDTQVDEPVTESPTADTTVSTPQSEE